MISDYTEKYGIHKVRIPLPFALDHVNCYIVRGKRGWDIIDTGLNISFTHRAWEEVTKKLNAEWKDIRGIYITHYHPDHYGAAGWLRGKTGAPVYMSQQDLANVQRVWHAGFDFMNDFHDFFLKHGVPEELLRNISESMIKTARAVFPKPPRVETISEGETVELGDYNYEVIHTPGHAEGHICFYCRQNGILISGDHLLPEITSNIGIWPGSHANPLKRFLSSLDKVNKLGAKIAVPAHGEIFSGIEERVNELHEHHRERLDLMARTASGGRTAFAIAQDVFGTELTFHEIRFAISETIAHMVYLENENIVESFTENGMIRYKKV